MESHKLETHEFLTVLRNLKAARRAKQKEERKEEARLEELKLRLRIKIDQTQHPDSTPVTKTA